MLKKGIVFISLLLPMFMFLVAPENVIFVDVQVNDVNSYELFIAERSYKIYQVIENVIPEEVSLRSMATFIDEWFVDLKSNDIFTLALLNDNGSYLVVTGNGKDIVIVNSSGSILRTWNLSSVFNGVSPSIYGFGYLGSNLTHVFSAVSYLYNGISIGFATNYELNANILYITPDNITLSPEKNVKRYSFASRYMQVRLLGRIADPELDRNLMPAMKSYFGNISAYMFPLVFYANGFNLFMLDDSDSKYVDLGLQALNITYLAEDLLPNVNGTELVVAVNNTDGGRVFVYTLINSSDGYSNDENNNECVTNITFTGDLLDIATYDVDGDNAPELLIENDSLLTIWEVQQDGTLVLNGSIATGPMDDLIVGNFMGSGVEFAFYDPVTSEIEIWNSTNQVYSLAINGTPIHDLVVGDFDSDSYDDILTLTQQAAYFIYGRGLNDSYVLAANATSNALIADIDGDGNLEFIYATNNTLRCVETSFTGIGNTQYVNPLGVRSFSVNLDTDLDGISDAEELYVYSTSPYDPTNTIKFGATFAILIPEHKEIIRVLVAMFSGDTYRIINKKSINKVLIKTVEFNKVYMIELANIAEILVASIIRW